MGEQGPGDASGATECEAGGDACGDATDNLELSPLDLPTTQRGEAGAEARR